MFKTYPYSKEGMLTAGVPSSAQGSRGAVGATVKRRTGSGGRGNSEMDSFYRSITGNAGPGFGVDRYNPVFDPLEQGSVVEDWIPRDQPGINLLMRRIHTRDDVGGPMVDIYKEMMFGSGYDLIDIDEKMAAPYRDSLENLNILELMPALASEDLIIGRGIVGLGFEGSRGVFTHAIPHNPDWVRIKPIPIFGEDPLLDMQSNQSQREFMASQDERVIQMQSLLPASVLQAMESGSGWNPLHPLTTIFVRRMSSPYDYIGTSVYTRILNFWAVQKALIDATVVALRRRAAGVLHVKVGNEKWHASDIQMRDIAGLWMQAEEDIGGGIVVTREGVEADRSASAVGDIWKWSDEYPFISEGKMRAIGVSDAFLSGDASYNSAEMALSSFLERMRGFRDHITNQAITRKIFHTLARVHGHIKPDKNSPQGRRQAWTMPTANALKIEPHRLMVPKVHWHKALHPNVDETYLGVLERLREAGLPVLKQHLAVAGGFDLDKAIEMIPKDMEQDKAMKKWQAATTGAEGEEGVFARVRVQASALQRIKDPARMRVASAKVLEGLPLWGRRKSFLELSLAQASAALRKVLPLVTQDVVPPSKVLLSQSGLQSPEARALFRYVLVRMGFAPGYGMDDNRMKRIATHIVAVNNQQTAFVELQTMAQLCSDPAKPKTNREGGSRPSPLKPNRGAPVGGEKITGLPNGPGGKHVLSGVVPKKPRPR